MKYLYHTLCIVCCLWLVGCGSRSHIPGLVDVQITITQEGKPFEGAIVVLEAPGKMFSPSGVSNKNGVAVIHTSGTEKGAQEGEYKVCVTKTVTIETGKMKEIVETWRYVEPQYAHSDTTPLAVSVKGKTKATFDVGKALRVLVQ